MSTDTALSQIVASDGQLIVRPVGHQTARARASACRDSEAAVDSRSRHHSEQTLFGSCRAYIASASYRIRVCSPANSLNKIDYERTISEQFRARERRQSATAQHLNVCALKRAYTWGCRSLPIYWSPRNELNFITAISLMNEFQQFAKCLRECLSTWTRRIPLPHQNVKESVWLSSSALLFLPSVILCSCSRNNA